MTNAEKFKTAKERSQAFGSFCNSHRKGLSCLPACANCEFKDADIRCTFLWLECETPTEKPLSCPFCEAKGNVIHGGNSRGHLVYFVTCDNCECRTMHYETKSEAIAAWNRRAK